MPNHSQFKSLYKKVSLDEYADQLLAFYKKCSGSKPEATCTNGFLKNHVVSNGSFNTNKALKIAKQRKKEFSTVIMKKDLRIICKFFLTSGRLKTHLLRSHDEKYNYNVPAVRYIEIHHDKERDTVFSQPVTGRIRLGLDRYGFLNHYETAKAKALNK